MRNCLVIAAGLLFLGVSGAAAQSTDFGVGAYVGASIPVHEYGDDDVNDANAGHADLGISAGVELYYPFGEARQMWWLTTVGVTSHAVGELPDVPDDATVNGYLMFPLMTGLRYDIPISDYAAFLTAQVGGMFLKGPDIESSAVSVDSDWTTMFGFAVGAGFQATDRAHLGIRWMPLGDADLDFETTAGGTSTQTNEVVNISFIDLYIGFAVR